MNKVILDVVRANGYLPSPEDPYDVFWRLSKSCVRSDKLPQSVVGLKYLDSVFPHRFKARTSGFQSLHEAFHDDKQLWKVIDYVVSSGREPSREVVLRNLQFNIKVPSHFFPDSAAALCRTYAPSGDVYDAFTGWGGRALGAMCAGSSFLVSTDLQEDSSKSGMRMASDFSGLSKTSCEFVTGDFVSYMTTTSRKFDLIIASPPFLDTENYGSDHVRTVREWANSIAIPLAQQSKRVLRDGGHAVTHGQDRPSVPVQSILYTAFVCSGFSLSHEFRYGKTPGQSVLVWKSSR